MNAGRRNASVDVPTRRAPRPAMLRLASVLLLSLSAAGANADDECGHPGMDDLFWESTQCEFAQEYLRTCEFQGGRHVRKARECIAWDKVKKCDDLEKVVDFKKRFEGGSFESEADACIRRLNVAKRLQACGLVLDTRVKFECLQKAQGLDEFNIHVLNEINKLRLGILASAEEAMANRDIPAAESAVGDMEALFPRDKALRDLRNRLENLKDKQAQRDLEDRVRKLIAERKFKEALEELRKGIDQGMTGKTLESLEREATEGLAKSEINRQKRQEALAEARRLRDAEDFDGARRMLDEALEFGLPKEKHDAELEATEKAEDRQRKRQEALAEARRLRDAEDFDGARKVLDEALEFGLPKKMYDAELKATEKAEDRQRKRQEALAEARRLRDAEDFDGARKVLDEALEFGLPKKMYDAELKAIEKVEAGSRRVVERLRECKAHMDGSRLDEALACYQGVLEWDKGHREAKKQAARLEMLVEWRATDRADDIGRYHAFEQKYKERRDLGRWATSLSRLAREKLNSKQDEFWRSVKASGSRAMYERYVTIYPEGRYVGEAEDWLENEG